ncbi:MAG: GNAT family acetyltransferase [Desulfobacterales bacterium]|jgi:ribosomal protein S18 acetylase RimI-like enzyme
MSLTIRPYRPADQAQVIALWENCQLVVPQNDPIADIQTKVAFQPDLFLVALTAHGLVGTVMVGYEGHRGWINYLAVSPEHRRRGIGRELMVTAEMKLRQLGCPKINLQVRRSNAAVIDFYRSLGFREDKVVSLGKRLPK